MVKCKINWQKLIFSVICVLLCFSHLGFVLAQGPDEVAPAPLLETEPNETTPPLTLLAETLPADPLPAVPLATAADCVVSPFGTVLEIEGDYETFVDFRNIDLGGPVNSLGSFVFDVVNDNLQEERLTLDTNNSRNLVSWRTATTADLNGDGRDEFVQAFIDAANRYQLVWQDSVSGLQDLITNQTNHTRLAAAAGNLTGVNTQAEQLVIASRDAQGALNVLIWQPDSGSPVASWRSTANGRANAPLIQVAVGNLDNDQYADIVVALQQSSGGTIQLIYLEYTPGHNTGSGSNTEVNLKALTSTSFEIGTPSNIRLKLGRLTNDFQDEIVLLQDKYNPSTPGISSGLHLRVYGFNKESNTLPLVAQWSNNALTFNLAAAVGDIDADGRDEIVIGHYSPMYGTKPAGLHIDTLRLTDLNTPSLAFRNEWFSNNNYRNVAQYLDLGVADMNNDGVAEVIAAFKDDNRAGFQMVYLTQQFDSDEQPTGLILRSWGRYDATFDQAINLVVGDWDNNSIKAHYQSTCKRLTESRINSVVYIPPFWENIQSIQGGKGGSIGRSMHSGAGEGEVLTYERSHSINAFVGGGIGGEVFGFGAEASARGSFGTEYTNSNATASEVSTSESVEVQALGVSDFLVYENSLYDCYSYQLRRAADNLGEMTSCEYLESGHLNTDLDVWDGTNGNVPSDLNRALTWVPATRDWSSLALFRGASTAQSSNASNAALAVDGNLDGSLGGNSVTLTQVENNPWWQIDLGSGQEITKISLWNRTDDCGGTPCSQELADLYLFVSDIDFQTISNDPAVLQNHPHVKHYTLADLAGGRFPEAASDPAGRVTTFLTLAGTPPTPLQGRYVRVQLAHNNAILSLAEVQIFGPNHVEPDRYPTAVDDATPGDGFFEVTMFDPISGTLKVVSVRGNLVWNGTKPAGPHRLAPVLNGRVISVGNSSGFEWSLATEQARSEIQATSVSQVTRIGAEFDASAGFIGQLQAGYGREFSSGVTVEKSRSMSWGTAFMVGGQIQGFPTDSYNGLTWIELCNYQIRPYLYEVNSESSFGYEHRYLVLDYTVPHGVSGLYANREADLTNCRNGNQTGSTQATNDMLMTYAGGSFEFTPLGNDTGNDLRIISLGTPQHGAASFTVRTIHYTPNAGFEGQDSFTYTLGDGTTTSEATITITVEKRRVYLPLLIR